jgi:hypothetical protein
MSTTRDCVLVDIQESGHNRTNSRKERSSGVWYSSIMSDSSRRGGFGYQRLLTVIVVQSSSLMNGIYGSVPFTGKRKRAKCSMQSSWSVPALLMNLTVRSACNRTARKGGERRIRHCDRLA